MVCLTEEFEEVLLLLRPNPVESFIFKLDFTLRVVVVDSLSLSAVEQEVGVVINCECDHVFHVFLGHVEMGLEHVKLNFFFAQVFIDLRLVHALFLR